MEKEHQGLAKKKPKKDKIGAAVLFNCSPRGQKRCSFGKRYTQWFLCFDGGEALEVSVAVRGVVGDLFTESSRCSGTVQ